MKPRYIMLIVVFWIFGVVIGFLAGRFYPSGGRRPVVQKGRCVNDLGENRDRPFENSCDGKELRASCKGVFGEGTCQNTAN